MVLLKLIFGLFVVVNSFHSSESVVLCDGACAEVQSPLSLAICDKTKPPGRTTLAVMGLFPCNSSSFRARALTVAGQMAALAVRRSVSVLQNYSLELEFDNTMCSRPAGVRALIQQLQDTANGGSLRYMIIGPGCSSAAVLIAETAPFYQLTQISYTATSITLSDKQQFPTFLRTISSDNASIALVQDLIIEYQWHQVAIISLNNANFINLTTSMVETLTGAGVSVITERLSIDPEASDNLPLIAGIIQQLNMSGARVVVMNVFEDLARHLFCFAYQRGMVYPQYLFVSYYQYSQGWWTDSIDGVGCSVDQLISAIEFSIAMDYFPEPPPSQRDMPTDVELTHNEFWEYFRGNISTLGYQPIEALRQAGYVYDAVWAAALALDAAERQLRGGALPGMTSLLNYSNENAGINQLIFNAAINGRFRGVTGDVSINRYGDREPLGRFYQYRFENRSVEVPELSAFLRQENGSLVYSDGVTVESLFPDGMPATAQFLQVHVALWSVAIVFCVAGIVLSIACIVFNLVFRKKRCVKLTSPFLNVVIFIGAIFFYVGVILFGVDTNVASTSVVDGLCQATIWFSSIGFSLLFGPILAKAFRVYYIFRNVEKKKKMWFTQDYVLLLLVAIMLVIDVLFLIVVSVDIWRLRLVSALLQRRNGDIPVVVSRCQSSAGGVWLAVLLVYKAIYLFIGLLLASQTFNVKIKRLRDSKLIVVSVFATFIISIVLTVVGFFVTDNPDALYALLVLFILSLVTGLQLLLVVPRAVELIKDPSGEVDLVSSTSVGKTNIISNISPADNATIMDLRKTVDSLKQEIEKYSPGTRKRVLSSPLKDSLKVPYTNGHTDSFELGSRESFKSSDFDFASNSGNQLVPEKSEDSM